MSLVGITRSKLIRYIRKFGQFFVYSINDDGTYSVADFTDGVIEDFSSQELLRISDITKVHGVTEYGVRAITVNDYVSRLVARLRISGINISESDLKVFKARLAFMDKQNGYKPLLKKQLASPAYGYRLDSGRIYTGLLCAGGAYSHLSLSSPMLGAYYTANDKLLRIALGDGIPVHNMMSDSSVSKNIEYMWINDTAVQLRSLIRYTVGELIRLYDAYCYYHSESFMSFFNTGKVQSAMAIKVKSGMQTDCFVCSYTDPSKFEFDRCSNVVFKAVVIQKEELIRRYKESERLGYRTIEDIVENISEQREVKNESDLKKWLFKVLRCIHESYVPSSHEYEELINSDSLDEFFGVGLEPVELNYDRTIFG